MRCAGFIRKASRRRRQLPKLRGSWHEFASTARRVSPWRNRPARGRAFWTDHETPIGSRRRMSLVQLSLLLLVSLQAGAPESAPLFEAGQTWEHYLGRVDRQ